MSLAGYFMEATYLIASVLFVLALKGMSHPETARRGMFLAEVAAGPVYRLLGKKDLGTGEFPPVGAALVDGDLGFRQHPGGHTPAPNWPVFLEFASHYLHAPQSPGVLAQR